MGTLKKSHRFILVGLSALLLILPWNTSFSGIILLIAFVPLLIIERYFYENKEKNRSVVAFLYAYIVFLIWNLATTYWIVNATMAGAIVAFVLNSLFMAIVFWLFHITHRALGNRIGYFSLVVYWTSFEYLYMHVTVSWPWLNLGNGLGKDIRLIQWFELTGSLSATPWILFINILLFLIILEYARQGSVRKKTLELILLIILILFPVSYSLIRFYTYTETKNPYEIVVVQPNIDPYNEKFGGLSTQEQLDIMLELADSLTGPETDYIVGPETALDNNMWENNLGMNPYILQIKDFINQYPKAKFILGIQSMYNYGKVHKPTPTARKFRDANAWWDSFNASVQVDKTSKYQVYHKSKLVIGVEKMPSLKIIKSLEKFIINIGGSTGSYGTQKERSTLNDPQGTAKIGTLICYESIYGEFVTDYLKKGANILLVITNDGWWGNTPGYKQHLTYSSLRAIETRRSFARSANTGISCFINQKGEILQATNWWEPAVIKGVINSNEEITYYVKHGNFISRILSFFAALTFLYTIVISIINKKKQT